jgi:hypothetical protein
MNEEVRFLPDDTYRFIDLPLAVRSNSQDVLDYLRSVYGYFFIGNNVLVSHCASDGQDGTCVLQVIDHIEESQELVVQDSFESYTLRCKDLFELNPDDPRSKDGVPYPMAYVQWSVLKNIAARAEDYHLIHAGAVSWRDKALIFPGVSGRGKTTLCLGLLREGFNLLSDELACLHKSSGMVAPFPRATRLDERSRTLLKIDPSKAVRAVRTDGENAQWFLDVASAFPSAINGESTFRYLIFLRGFGETSRLEPISQTAALMELFRLCLGKPTDIVQALFEFGQVMRDVSCFSLIVGDLDETITLVKALVDDSNNDTGSRLQ